MAYIYPHVLEFLLNGKCIGKYHHDHESYIGIIYIYIVYSSLFWYGTPNKNWAPSPLRTMFFGVPAVTCKAATPAEAKDTAKEAAVGWTDDEKNGWMDDVIYIYIYLSNVYVYKTNIYKYIYIYTLIIMIMMVRWMDGWMVG